jgi:hypothetical protein
MHRFISATATFRHMRHEMELSEELPYGKSWNYNATEKFSCVGELWVIALQSS